MLLLNGNTLSRNRSIEQIQIKDMPTKISELEPWLVNAIALRIIEVANAPGRKEAV